MKDNPPSSFGTTISTTLLELQRVKYSTSDGRNRIGLRELLMEPVQRIPRYTLLFSQMIKQMPSHDPQRAKLIEAREYASKIAHADLDEETKRAATMYCLKASIEDFPASLWSSSRKFIDCIDVVDILQVGALEGPSTPGGSAGALLHCTLILFDDKLLIAKRVNTEKPSRQLLGLDDLDKVATQVKALSSGSKKHGMAYRGVVEVTDLACTDNGGAGAFIKCAHKQGLNLQLYLFIHSQSYISTLKVHLQTKQACGVQDHFANLPSFCHPPRSISILYE